MGNIFRNLPTINVDQFQLSPDTGSFGVHTNVPVNLNDVGSFGFNAFRSSTFVALSDPFAFRWQGPFEFIPEITIQNFNRYLATNLIGNTKVYPYLKLADLNFMQNLQREDEFTNYNLYTNPFPFQMWPNGMEVTVMMGNKMNWAPILAKKKYVFSSLFTSIGGGNTTSLFIDSEYTQIYGSTNDLSNPGVTGIGFSSGNNNLFSPDQLVTGFNSNNPDSYDLCMGGLLFENPITLTEYNPSTNEYIELETPQSRDMINVIEGNTQLRLTLKTFPGTTAFGNCNFWMAGIRNDLVSTYPAQQIGALPPYPTYDSDSNFKVLITTF